MVGAFTALLTGANFFLPANWIGVVEIVLLVIGLTSTMIVRWSRATGWGVRHRIAVAGGALFTAAWGAFIVGSFTGQTDAVTRLGNVIFGLFTAALVAWCLRRNRNKP
jgi:hypothetical protein